MPKERKPEDAEDLKRRLGKKWEEYRKRDRTSEVTKENKNLIVAEARHLAEAANRLPPDSDKAYIALIDSKRREVLRKNPGLLAETPFFPWNPQDKVARYLKASEVKQEASGRRGYRREVRSWMGNQGLETVADAAKRLGISVSTLKSIMSDTGEKRYGDGTLARVLKVIGVSE